MQLRSLLAAAMSILALLSLRAHATEFFSVVESTPANHLNVKVDAAAVGDGIADDTTAIQAAIDQALSQGKEVFFPAGRYKVTGNLTPQNGVNLVGSFTGLSMIEGNGGTIYDNSWSTALKSVTIQNLVFRQMGISVNGSATAKQSIAVKTCLFLEGGVYFGTAINGLIQDNLFLRTPDYRDAGYTAVNLYKTSGYMVQRNVVGLDLDQLGWLATQYSGYANWSELLAKLQYLRQQLGLYPDQGQFVNGMFPNRVVNTTLQFNIFNGSPNIDPASWQDHVIYAKDYNNLKIVANWMRGWWNNPGGGIKCRNATGALAVACNYLDDTGILYYIYNQSDVPHAFQNALTYKNHLKPRTNITAWGSGICYWNELGGGTEGNNNYDSNVIEVPPGTAACDIDVGSLGTWNVYPTNVYAGTATPISITPASHPYASGTIDPALIAPYQGIAVPVLNIPIYHDAPNVTGFTHVFTGEIPPGTVLGTVTATDADPGDTWTYAIAAGNELGQFAINPTTGVVTTNAALPYGTTDYTVTVAATDSIYGLVGKGSITLRRGVLRQERWTGITGSTVASLTANANYPNNPSSANVMTGFEYSNLGDNYGTRVAGYVVPSTTDNYTFYIASDDSSELWLSADGNPANKVKIAYVSGYTGVQQWTKYATQKSTARSLEAGRAYYVEVLHKDATASDNLAVGWETATQAVAVIPASNLAYQTNSVPATTDDIANTSEDSAVAIAVLANDSDWEGHSLALQSVTPGAHGTAVINGNSVTYSPAMNWNGTDNFEYSVSDRNGGVSTGTVTVTVSAVNDAPAFAANPISKPAATIGVPYTGSIAGDAGDLDAGEVLSFSKVSGPAWLAVSSSGAMSGVPPAGTTGSNSFVIRVTDTGALSADATVLISVGGGLPSGWSDADIGAVGVAGGASESNGTYSVSGSGADIWNTADAFRFAAQTLTGDGEIRARVNSQTNTNPWAKAGVMIRDGVHPGAANAFLAITPGNGFTFQWRASSSASSNYVLGPALNGAPNNWVRLTRSGTLLSAYVSGNGATWTQVGTTTISMGASVSAGLAVTSHDTTVASTATFDNVSLTPFPAPWQTVDIGMPSGPSNAEFFGSAFTLKGSGLLSGSTDAFRYVYQTLSGDGEIRTRNKAVQNTGSNARVGVMIRDTLTGSAEYAFMGIDGGGTFYWQRRSSTGGATWYSTSGVGAVPNTWVRLVRIGNTFLGYKSSDGVSWTLVNSRNISMNTTITIGLIDASGDPSSLNTASFDSMTVVP